jgi:hypothetical protein
MQRRQIKSSDYAEIEFNALNQLNVVDNNCSQLQKYMLESMQNEGNL